MTVITTSNPYHADAAGTLWDSGPARGLRLVQWVDTADIVHDSTLVLTINGVTLTVQIQPLNDNLAFGAVVWQIGPFNPGIPVTSFVITTMATGHLHVWVD